MKIISQNHRKKNARGVSTFPTPFQGCSFGLDLLLFGQMCLRCTCSCQVLIAGLKYPHFSSFIYPVNYLGWFFWGEKALRATCSSFCALVGDEDNEGLSEILTVWSIWIIQIIDNWFWEVFFFGLYHRCTAFSYLMML